MADPAPPYLNALTGIARLVPDEDLSIEIAGLIVRHGAPAVRAELVAQTKKRRGPKRLAEPGLFKELAEEDARRWLDGFDPLVEKKNHKVARDYAKRRPGHDELSTVHRIQRKLGLVRKAFMIQHAFILSLDSDDWPWERHRDAAREYDALREGKTIFAGNIDQAVADYIILFGEAPVGSLRRVRQRLTVARMLTSQNSSRTEKPTVAEVEHYIAQECGKHT